MFFFFFFLVPADRSHSLNGYMGPPSRWRMQEGGFLLFFHRSTPAVPLCSRTRSGSPQRLWFIFSFLFLSHSLISSFCFIHIPFCSRLPLSCVASVASPHGHASPLSRPPMATCRLCRVSPWPHVPPCHASPSPLPCHCRVVVALIASPLHRAHPSSCVAPSPHAPLITRRPSSCVAPSPRAPLITRRPSHVTLPRRGPRLELGVKEGLVRARAGWSAVQAE